MTSFRLFRSSICKDDLQTQSLQWRSSSLAKCFHKPRTFLTFWDPTGNKSFTKHLSPMIFSASSTERVAFHAENNKYGVRHFNESLLQHNRHCSHILPGLKATIYWGFHRGQVKHNHAPSACSDLCGLQNLTTLDLSSNQLTRLPHCLNKLTSLQVLVLDANNLTESTALEGLCTLKNLQWLYIDDNQLLDGSIPPCLGNLSSLQTLWLANNHLMGSLDLCGLQSLTELYLSGNQLTRLPHCLNKLTSLQELELGNNNLTESAALEGLCTLENLQTLSIGNSQLVDGSIPPCLGNLSSLDTLELSNNHLMGSLDLCGLQNLTGLDLSWNQLTRLPHCLNKLTSLQVLYLENNNLTESDALEGVHISINI